MIRAIVARDGVIGINFFDRFLLQPEQYGRRRANLADVLAHIQHICDLAGSCKHVAIGTDMDGGLGRNEIPVEIQTSADLPLLAAHLADRGFADRDVAAIMSGNWIRFFNENLPD
jgi:membrane dipeptidase